MDQYQTEAAGKIVVPLNLYDRKRSFVSRTANELIKAGIRHFAVNANMMAVYGLPYLKDDICRGGGKIFLDLQLQGSSLEEYRDVVARRVALFVAHIDVWAFSFSPFCRTDSMEIITKDKSAPLAFATTESEALNGGNIPARVKKFASSIMESGCDGIVCDPAEARCLRATTDFENLSVMTSGLTLGELGIVNDPHSISAQEVVDLGIDYVIIDKSIADSADPFSSAMSYINKIAVAM